MNDKRDEKILELFWSRDEGAVAAADEKYRGFAMSILYNLLGAKEDREECFNDALLALWNSIPPERPRSLSAFLAKILRNLAFKRSREENAWKRGGRVITVRDEFLGDISDGRTLADDYRDTQTGRIINEFLDSLPESKRQIFMLRYWFGEDISRISMRTGKSSGSIAKMLERMREKLRVLLVKEGILNE